MIFTQSKGNNSSTTNDILVKLLMQNHTIVIYIQNKFYDLPFIGYLVMIEDGKIIEKRSKLLYHY